jgi:CII-binding regulator of phage lambda lysogenization HflD
MGASKKESLKKPSDFFEDKSILSDTAVENFIVKKKSLKAPLDFFESTIVPTEIIEEINIEKKIKNPSDFFEKTISVDTIEEDLSESVREYEEIPDGLKLDYFADKIDFLSEQLSKKADKTDLETAMVSQLETLDENIQKLKTSYEGLGEIKNDLLREEFSNKLNNISESIDNNIELINKKFEKSSLQLRRDIAAYNSITKIVENKVEKLSDAEASVDNKIEEISNSVDSFIADLGRQVDRKLKGAIKDYVIELKNRIDDVRYDIDNLQEVSFRSDISRLEDKIDYIRETYQKIDPESTAKEVIEESLLSQRVAPDPLAKDDFVTLPQLQEHYRLFLNRIQQQLSTIGGGGIEDAPKGNDIYLRSQQRWKKFSEVGVVTFQGVHIDPTGVGITEYSEDFIVEGNARVTGILSIGTASIVLDPEAGSVSGLSEINANTITAETASFSGNVSIAGTLTYEDVTNIDSIGVITARNGIIATGVITATSFDGDGSKLTGISTFSGDYNDLTNTPTIPSDTGDLTNNVGFITAGASGAGLTALTGASQGTYGNATNTPQITVDANGRITSIGLVGISGGGGSGGLSGINFFNGQTSLGVSTHLSFGDNVTATSIGNTITVNVTGVVTSLVGYATEGYVDNTVASGISSVGINSGGTNVGTAKTINFGTSLNATVSGEVATVNVSIPLSALTDVNTSNLSGITTDYLMVYDPTIPGFKFVDPKTYFGINNDANAAPDIVDYGGFG